MRIVLTTPYLTQRASDLLHDLSCEIALVKKRHGKADSYPEGESDGPRAHPSDDGRGVALRSPAGEAMLELGRQAATAVVEAWAQGWDEDNPDAMATTPQPDRGAILLSCPNQLELNAYLRQPGGYETHLVAVGATPAMSANIVAVGGMLGVFTLVAR